eukprot:scaffold19373_cov145-Skeletonema_menzelii.AAC.3
MLKETSDVNRRMHAILNHRARLALVQKSIATRGPGRRQRRFTLLHTYLVVGCSPLPLRNGLYNTRSLVSRIKWRGGGSLKNIVKGGVLAP